MIEIERLRKAYGDRVVLSVEQWSLTSLNVVLAGDNGAGKTTLLLMLAGLETPDQGAIRVRGHVPQSLGARTITSFAPDQPALFDDLTVADQMTYVARLHGLDRPFEASASFVDALQAEPLLDRFPRGMSKGQRQKSGLLVATARPFELLLLDEPTTGLDAASRHQLAGVLGTLAQGGVMVVSSTHDAELIAAADEIVRVADGSLHAG